MSRIMGARSRIVASSSRRHVDSVSSADVFFFRSDAISALINFGQRRKADDDISSRLVRGELKLIALDVSAGSDSSWLRPGCTHDI